MCCPEAHDLTYGLPMLLLPYLAHDSSAATLLIPSILSEPKNPVKLSANKLFISNESNTCSQSKKIVPQQTSGLITPISRIYFPLPSPQYIQSRVDNAPPSQARDHLWLFSPFERYLQMNPTTSGKGRDHQTFLFCFLYNKWLV